MTVESVLQPVVPQVHRATKFFTWMTVVMIATAIVMLVSEWGTWAILAPVVILAGVLAATGLTIWWILPHQQTARRRRQWSRRAADAP